MAHVTTSGIVLLEADENVGTKYFASSKYTDSSNCITREIQTNLVIIPDYFGLISRERILPTHKFQIMR
jgi:hypothetical protein